jgi:hypothetical protein
VRIAYEGDTPRRPPQASVPVMVLLAIALAVLLAVMVLRSV